ncbi:MAG TPA: hypothetical protein VLV76_25520 [Candidatus Acidoferrum sp.]|nr:hypothetical protein [Candidatus Acidoferrum sp.]
MAADEKQDDVRALRDEVARLRADIAALAKDLRSLGTAAAGAAEQAAQSGGERLKTDLDEAIAALRRRAEETLRDAKAGVEERPLFAVLIALAIGFILGKVLDRR